MKKSLALGVAAALLATTGIVAAQEGIGRNDPDGNYRPLDEGLTVFGGFDFAESCSYDPSRDLIVVPNMGNRINDGFHNDGWVSLVNHDGSVHTLQWIASNEDTGAFVNDPFGSDIVGGVLYLADRTGGTAEDDPQVAVVTMWDMATGGWIGMHSVPESTGFNDIEVMEDGTIYASDTGANRIFKVNPDGTSEIFIDDNGENNREGEIFQLPNGVAFDGDGNIVVANIFSDNLHTFSPDGELLKTEHTVDGGDDGLVIMEDGTKYISSVRFGSITRIAPDGTAELIAVGMPGGASMCYDPTAHQLVVPMNNANALVLVPLGM
jgi:sugar lactone lactonase YvrE